MPRGRSKKKKSKKKSARKRKKAPPRPYKLDKKSRARHRYRKVRHRRSKLTGHHKRALDEAMLTNDLLTAIAKHHKPALDAKHFQNDPEYAFSGPRMQEFKRGFAAPTNSLLRPQGPNMPPHLGNFPEWRPEWVHTYHHPHEIAG